MPAKRTFAIPPPNTSPRNSLPHSKHATVDTVLKDLKQCSRRLQSALEMQHVELQVLNKLYYKGNNQHRTALFWRRVSDIRKFGRRLEGADLKGLVEGVRVSFWGNEAYTNPKILKGPWTCYPDANSLQTVLLRLIDVHTLVTSMHDHVTKAHNHFNLEFQTGAFLQLILTLTAISSRIGMLQIKLRTEIEVACRSLYRLLVSVLQPTAVRKVPSWVTLSPSLSDSPEQAASARESRDTEPPAELLDTNEDIGMAVSAKANVVNVAEEILSASMSSHQASVTTAADDRITEFTFAKVKTQTTSSTIVRASTPKEAKDVTHGKIKVAQKSSAKRSSEDTSASLKVKRKKKRKDEIDDIFGF